MKNLTDKQFLNVLCYFEYHKPAIIEKIKQAETATAPTLEEDKNNPEIWKPIHWRWFKESLHIRNYVFDTIQDLLSDFFYYDRKEDEELPVGRIHKLVKDGVITVDEIKNHFEQIILNEFKD